MHTIHTVAPSITCPVCDGTGHDDAFGGTCGVCNGEGHTHARTWGRTIAGIVGTTYRLPTGGGTGTGTRQAGPVRTNAYSAPCTRCGSTVAAGEGILARQGGTWAVSHRGTCPAAPAPVAAPVAAPDAAERTNRYAGPCTRCGGHVPAQAGLLVKDSSGRWAAAHRGECPARPAPATTRATASLHDLLATLPVGYYALPCKTGSNDLDFVAVRQHQGHRYVRRYLGGQGLVSMYRNEQLTFARALAALTPEQLAAAGTLFGQSVGHCCKCGRSLTDETSRALGIGPDCRSHG